VTFQILTPETFLQQSARFPVADVRSPGEYRQGHIPGAFSIPLFDNEERARVGTTYVQIGKEPAIELGQEIAGYKTGYFIDEALKIAPERKLLLHCWRGGMRSARIAAFYTENGFEVGMLEGGYKAYRGYIRKRFSDPQPLNLIGGYTGSGKTAILKELGRLGGQTINLEELACHKGSLFGHLGQHAQPSTEQFENELARIWMRLNRAQTVWVEHESVTIGNIYLPDTFHRAMLSGTLFFIEVPLRTRIRRLVDEYACFEKDELNEVLLRLSKYMGAFQSREAIHALEIADYEKVAEITLRYYDKIYDNSLIRRPVKHRVTISLSGSGPEEQAREMLMQSAAWLSREGAGPAGEIGSI
jgi:tRNA 2-selenouridine synthase